MVEDILKLVLGDLPWQFALAGIIYAFFAATWSGLWKSEPARDRWIGYLRRNNRYRAIMGGALDWIDTRLTPEVDGQGWARTDLRTAWSHNLLSLLLVMALAYPLFSLFAVWVYGGEAGRIGTFTFLLAEPSRFWRYAPLGLMTLSGILFFLGQQTHKSRWRPILFIPAIGILLLAVPHALPDGAVGGAAAFAFAFALAVGGAVALAVGGAGAGAAPLAGALAVVWLGERTGKPMPFLLAWACLGLIAILVAVSFGATRLGRFTDDSSIILFIGILPLLNGIADFASTGLTRYYLRQGTEGSPWLCGAKDFFGGALIFTLLVTTMMAIAAWVYWPDGTPLLDLVTLLTDIRANPGDYWWLYITFLTTLLPTLLHLGIALFAMVFEMWPGLRAFIVTGLTEGGKGDDPKGRWALRALCLTMTVALMLPIMIFGWIIQYHGIVGTALLDLFEGIACITNMLPSSAPVCI